MDKGLKATIVAAGSRYRIAKALGIKPQAVQGWTRIPAERMLAIEAAFGVPREIQRPEFYRKVRKKDGEGKTV